MALKLANRVKESTSTSGSGTITLNGADAGYQAFSSALSNGDTTYYTVVDSNSWEVGIGTYNSNTLSRDTILSSSNSNNKINLTGVGSVFIAYPAEKSIYKDAGNRVVIGSSGIIVESGIPSNTNNVLYNVGNALYFNGVSLTPSISGGYGIAVANNSGNYSISSTLTAVNEAYSLITTVFNRTSSPIPKFTAVYISGGQGDLPVIRPAIANGESTSSKTFGITQDVIASMDSGRVVSYGNITSLDTDQYNPSAPHGDINGRVLYLSPSISGGLTLTKPYAPDHIVALGTVIRTHQNEGVFNVRVQNGFELEELHNVATTGAISGQFLKYDGNLWKNNNILSSDISDFASAVSGISPNISISISGASGIAVDKNGNAYTVYATGNFGLSSSQVQSLLNSGVSIYVTGGTGNFSSLSVNGTGVSLSGHVHTSSQITDFNTSVSGLINVKNINGSGYATVTSSGGVFTVAVTGLQPSGNYSLTGHTHIVSDITNFSSGVSGLLVPYALLSSGNFTNLYVTGVPVSTSGHTHTVSQITNFNSSVSGLLPSVSGSGYVVSNFSNNTYILSTSGLQPSGNYSLVGHTHSSSDIANFNSSVSGLLPVKDIIAGTNITINSLSGIYTINAISASGGGGSVVISNPANNRVLTSTGSTSGINAESNLTFDGSTLGISGLLSASSGNFINSLQLNGVGVSLSGHTHTASNIVDFNSSVSGLLTPYALLSSGNFSTLFVTGIPVSVSGHAHTASSITNFNSAVSGLLPSVSGSGFTTVTFSNNVYTVGVTGLQPSGNYSLIGHTHIASDITDFNSAVSGLIPIKNINGSGYVIVSSSGGIFTVGVTGLQPSGNYSLVGHSHIVSDITNFNSGVSGLLIPYALLNSGNFTNLFVNAVPVSTSGHTHLSSSITNFNSSVSGLLPAVSGSGFARVVLANNIYTVSITGLQPSGNYSVSGHQHIASDISNFNSSVSGLLSPYALLSSGNFTNLFITGIPVSLSGHLHTSNQITDFNSSVSGLLPVKDILAGTNVTISSANGIYTINAVSISGGGGGISITNPGDNRILTSTGSPSGANAESNLNFDGSILSVSGSINANSGNFLNTLQVNGTGVSLVGHTHISSNITDFNSAVSGLIPVKNIVSSGYVVVSSSGGIFTVGVTGLQPTGNYSLVGHTHSSSDITNFNSSVSGLLPSVSGSGYATVGFLNNIYTISVTGLQPSGNYSVVGHTHIASNITDFNSAVSGLLPVKNIGGSGYVSVTSNAGNYTVSVTGLQPSGNYSVVGHTHLASDITNFNSATSGLLIPYALLSSGNFSSLYVNGTAVSVSGHTHTSSQIADFNSSVSGLINVKNITGSGYVSVTSSAGNFTIGVTGLQPSGNYSLVGHTHTASNITDFNSSVSGLLSPYALLSSGNFTNLFVNGTRVSISGHTHTSTDITNFNSSVSGLLPSVSGSGYASVGFSNNVYRISVTGLQPSGNYSIVGHTHIASNITDFNNAVSGLLNPYALLSSGNFNYLAVNGVPVSTGTSGGGGGANITNPGIDRVLLSDGTSDGIIAQSGLTFDGKSLFINGVNSRNGQNLYMWANFR